MKQFKQRIQKGEALTGTFLSLGNPVVSEMIGHSGFDFVIIDLEHGVGNEQDTLHQLQALEAGTAAAVVRVESCERQRVHRVLDMGAEGIMFPRIHTVEEAHRAVSALYYPPSGVRGVAKLVRTGGYGQNFGEYLSRQKEDIVGIIQVETREILDCVEEVAALEGVDVLFVGPMDLSMALGVFGEFKHPSFTGALDLTARAARKAGKVCGILLPSPAYLPEWYGMGYRFFTGGGDLGFISSGAGNMAKSLKETIAGLN
jgi:4-hydroxy-2-oxoheptanedioate aldolase